jgi:hypothetical protein
MPVEVAEVDAASSRRDRDGGAGDGTGSSWNLSFVSGKVRTMSGRVRSRFGPDEGIVSVCEEFVKRAAEAFPCRPSFATLVA